MFPKDENIYVLLEKTYRKIGNNEEADAIHMEAELIKIRNEIKNKLIKEIEDSTAWEGPPKFALSDR